MKLFVPFPLVVLVAALGAAPNAAQTPLHAQYALLPGQNNFGDEAACDLGDVDGDGASDYAVGARMGAGTPGYVAVYSGATGDLLATVQGNGGTDPAGGSDRFGTSVAGVGDVDGDLVPDLLVGAPQDDVHGLDTGVARLISGSDWSLIREHTGALTSFGVTVATLGDVDLDGVSEYLVGERTDVVHCYSGATGAELWTFQGHHFDFATNLSPVTGDGNGDGVPDALIGAQAGHSFSLGKAYVVILDGATGTEFVRVTSGITKSLLGASLSWVGDVNGDGRDDFGACLPGTFGGGPDLEVYDGFTGGLVYGLTGTIALDDYVAGVGDQDGDGRGDFVAGDGGVPKVFSGATGTLLRALDAAPMAYQTSSTWLAPLSDLDADGRQEIVVGNHWGGGAAVVFLSSEHRFDDLGFALGGTNGDPHLVVEGTLQEGSLLRTRLSNAWTFTPAFMTLGFTRIDFPLLGGTFVPSPDFSFKGLDTGSQGHHEMAVNVPDGIPGGTELYMQFWILGGGGPQGVTASNAVRGVFP